MAVQKSFEEVTPYFVLIYTRTFILNRIRLKLSYCLCGLPWTAVLAVLAVVTLRSGSLPG
jgi:hypothetical protein